MFALARHTHDSVVLQAMGEARFFRQSADLVRATPVFRMQRAVALGLLPELVDLLEEHLNGAGPTG